MCGHGVEQIECTKHIVTVVFGRILHRFANISVSGEMHDCIDLVFRKNCSKEFAIGKIADDQFCRINKFPMTEDQVVQYDRRVSGAFELSNGMGADVTGAAGDEDSRLFVFQLYIFYARKTYEKFKKYFRVV